MFKGLRPVLEGVAVTMHEGACEQEVRSRGRHAEGLDVLFAQARVYSDNKPRQVGHNHDYNMTI